MTMDKVTFDKLPFTREVTGAKRWSEARGEFAQIAYREEIRHLALFEIKKASSRGGHYHENKEEIFYIASGRIEATFLDLDTREKGKRVFEKGDWLRIQPRCGHLFTALEDTLVVEYSPQFYEPEDNCKVELTAEGKTAPRSSTGGDEVTASNRRKE